MLRTPEVIGEHLRNLMEQTQRMTAGFPQPSAGERGGKESDSSVPPHWNEGDIKELP